MNEFRETMNTIDVRSLRLRNLVYYKYHDANIISRVEAISYLDDIITLKCFPGPGATQTKVVLTEDVYSIEITPASLEKLEFRNAGFGEYTHKNLGNWFIAKDFSGRWIAQINQIESVAIPHVHDLQNFFYAITGRDLGYDKERMRRDEI